MLDSISRWLDTITSNQMVIKIWLVFSAFLANFFLPILPVIILCFAAILVDCYYGIKVAVKLKLKIESRLSWHGSIKKIKETFAILALSRGIEYYIFLKTGMYILTGGTALLITLTEVWSILENMNTLNPYGPWKAISAFLRKKGNDYLGLDIQALLQGQIKLTTYAGINNTQTDSTVSQETSTTDGLSGTSILSGLSILAK